MKTATPKRNVLAKEITDDLATLYKVHASLVFLATNKIVKSEAVLVGCRNFVKQHPDIRKHLGALLVVDFNLAPLLAELQHGD